MKTLNLKSIAIMLLTLIVFSFLSMIPVSATSVDTTVVDTTVKGSTMGNTDVSNPENPAGIPNASIEDLEQKAESKMFSIVSLLQTVGKPFFIICFIISLVFVIIGLFGRAGVWKGVIGMFLSGILYACVMYAPEIVEWIQIWFAS